jgi:hypothetical protein
MPDPSVTVHIGCCSQRVRSNQHAIGELGSGREHKPLGIAVRSRTTRRNLYHLDAHVSQDRATPGHELASPVAAEKPELVDSITEIHREVADLLGGPPAVRWAAAGSELLTRRRPAAIALAQVVLPHPLLSRRVASPARRIRSRHQEHRLSGLTGGLADRHLRGRWLTGLAGASFQRSVEQLHSEQQQQLSNSTASSSTNGGQAATVTRNTLSTGAEPMFATSDKQMPNTNASHATHRPAGQDHEQPNAWTSSPPHRLSTH